METILTLLVLSLWWAEAQGHSLHFKRFHVDLPKIHVPDIDVKVKLPKSIPRVKLPDHLDVPDINVKLPKEITDIKLQVKPVLKDLEKLIEDELDYKVKVRKGNCTSSNKKWRCCQHVEIAKIGLKDTICVAVIYLPKEVGVEFTLTINGKTYINTSISGDIMTGATCGAGDAHSSRTPDLTFGYCEATNPPPICLAIPYLKKFASICIKFTKLHIDKANRTFSGCVSLEAKLKFVAVEEIKLGCFKLPPGEAMGNGAATEINSTPLSGEDKFKLLSRLGLMGKRYNNGRLTNKLLLN